MAEFLVEPNNGIYRSDHSDAELEALWEEFRVHRPDLYQLLQLPYGQRTDDQWRGIHTQIHLWLAYKYAEPDEPIPDIVSKTKSDMTLFWTRYLSPYRTKGPFNA
jgi:hypothetical protein